MKLLEDITLYLEKEKLYSQQKIQLKGLVTPWYLYFNGTTTAVV